MDGLKSKKECSWLFGFRLGTEKRDYDLYSPTRSDMQHWIKIFNLIIQMYRDGRNTTMMTP